MGHSTGQSRLRRTGLAAAWLLSTTMIGGTAYAQAAAPEQPSATEGQSIDDIIVTARRREETAQTVPVSITAISSDVLEHYRVQGIQDLQALEPSLSVSASSGRPNSPVYALRGIRPTESVYGQDPTVAIYLADVVQSPAQGSNLGLYDLQNIQVLKGPQGTLFGRNTIGGAILMTPRAPGRDFGANIMVGAGSYGLFETEVGIDLPLSDTFRMRIAGRTIDGGDYQTYVGGPQTGQGYGGQTTRSVRVTAVADLSPDVTNTLMVTYDDKEGGRGSTLQAINPTHPQAGLNPLYAPAFAAALVRARNRPVTDIESDLVQYDNVRAWSITNTTQANLNDHLTFKLIGGYREVVTRTLFDLDATTVANILSTAQQANLRHTSAEAQLLGTSERFDWVAGLYYYSEYGNENSPGRFFGTLISQRGEVENTSISAFVQGSYRFTDELTLTAGARYNIDHREMIIRQDSNGTVCLLQVANPAGGLTRLPITGCAVPLADTFRQPTGTISLDYRPSPGVMFYVASHYGYRSGGFNIRASQPVQYLPFEPETVLDFEGGAKVDWNVGTVRFRTNLAVFYQQYQDIQRTVAIAVPGSGTPASVVTNAASAHVFGIELQQTIRPVEGLTFQINYAYNEPRYDEWIDPATNTDLSSTPFFFTPRHSGSVRMTYEQPLPGNMGTLRFGANAAFQDDVWINALHTSAIIALHPASVLPLLQQPSYWLVDGNIGWDNVAGSGIDLSVYVRNLTDETYKIGGIQLYTGASGFISAAFGEPRTWGVQARYRF